MFQAVVTLRGIEDYFEEQNGKTLFDDVVLPDGIDKEKLVPFIITRAGDFPVMVIDPDYIYNMTNNWFSVWYDNFDKMNQVLQMSYNPLENYDRSEHWLDSENHENHGGTDTENTNEHLNFKVESKGSITDKRAAYNSNSGNDPYDPYNYTETDGENTTTGKVKDTGKITNNSHGKSQSSHDGRIHGNIGVTTSQQMLISEWDLRKEYNIYEYIAEKYVEEFCVMIY